MEGVTIRQAAAMMGAAAVRAEEGLTVSQVCTDTRDIRPGCLFWAIRGERFDGNEFIPQAFQLGAAAAVADRPVEGACNVLQVEDTRQALLRFAGAYRERFQIPVIGVTGSVGKTSTKEMIAAILSARGKTLKTEGNRNNEIGMPLTLLELDASCRSAVLEMGMSNFGEIGALSRACQPTIGVITNIGVSHLETLGSRENILKAKLEICAGLPDGAPLALNADDEYLCRAKDQGLIPGRLAPAWYGIDAPWADVRALEVRTEGDGQRFVIADGPQRFEAYIPAAGRHNVYNALAAYTAASRLGLDKARCAAALADYQATGMRQHLVHKAGLTVVEDCYNASPDSMKASLAMFRELDAGGGKKYALLGDMLELGAISEEAHRQVGRWAAEAHLAGLVALGPASGAMAEEAEKAGLAAVHCDTPAAALEALKGLLKPGDALLAKASRGMKLENILKALYGEETLH